jgi:hypothetical protein
MNTFANVDAFIPSPTELAESDLDSVSGGGSPLLLAIAAGIALLAESCKAVNDYEARHK